MKIYILFAWSIRKINRLNIGPTAHSYSINLLIIYILKSIHYDKMMPNIFHVCTFYTSNYWNEYIYCNTILISGMLFMPNMRLTTEGFYMFLTMDHSFKWKSLALPFHGGILFAKTCFHNKLVDIQMCNMIGVVKTNEWKFLKHKNSPYRLSLTLNLSLSLSHFR